MCRQHHGPPASLHELPSSCTVCCNAVVLRPCQILGEQAWGSRKGSLLHSQSLRLLKPALLQVLPRLATEQQVEPLVLAAHEALQAKQPKPLEAFGRGKRQHRQLQPPAEPQQRSPRPSMRHKRQKRSQPELSSDQGAGSQHLQLPGPDHSSLSEDAMPHVPKDGHEPQSTLSDRQLQAIAQPEQHSQCSKGQKSLQPEQVSTQQGSSSSQAQQVASDHSSVLQDAAPEAPAAAGCGPQTQHAAAVPGMPHCLSAVAACLSAPQSQQHDEPSSADHEICPAAGSGCQMEGPADAPCSLSSSMAAQQDASLSQALDPAMPACSDGMATASLPSSGSRAAASQPLPEATQLPHPVADTPAGRCSIIQSLTRVIPVHQAEAPQTGLAALFEPSPASRQPACLVKSANIQVQRTLCLPLQLGPAAGQHRQPEAPHNRDGQACGNGLPAPIKDPRMQMQYAGPAACALVSAGQSILLRQVRSRVPCLL